MHGPGGRPAGGDGGGGGADQGPGVRDLRMRGGQRGLHRARVQGRRPPGLRHRGRLGPRHGQLQGPVLQVQSKEGTANLSENPNSSKVILNLTSKVTEGLKNSYIPIHKYHKVYYHGSCYAESWSVTEPEAKTKYTLSLIIGADKNPLLAFCEQNVLNILARSYKV